MNPMHKKVEEAIAKLGTTREETEAALREPKITGVQHNPGFCPIANYARRAAGNPDWVSFLVGPTNLTISDHTEKRAPEHLVLELPPGARKFIEKFDKGEAPEFLEKPRTAPFTVTRKEPE